MNMHFPTIKGRTVNRDPRTIPQDFTGQFNVVILAFTREHQADVNNWLPFLGTLKNAHSTIEVYELPVLPELSPRRRQMLDDVMYMGIPEYDTRDRTITLYTDIQAFLQPMNITDQSIIHTLLVDQTGGVHWYAPGIYTEAKGISLRDVVQTVAQPTE